MNKEVRISLYHSCKLILFSLTLFVGCAQRRETSKAGLSIRWKNGQATGLSIPLSLLKTISRDEISESVKVQLAKPGTKTAIWGDYKISKDTLVFEPLIPFTGGLRYEVVFEKKVLADIEIPTSTDIPVLSGIYPSQDTLPENLLKLYFVFSRPMVEGHSLQYISLLNQQGDTLPRTFLNLQPELWNAEKTILTLWLDPGRIKRDLQPNKLLGTPLRQGERYKLVVSNQWPDDRGTTLNQNYTKNFVVTTRDNTSPSTNHWQLKTPQKGTLQPLEVSLKETLDYILLQNAVQVADRQGQPIEGSIQLSDEERKWKFIPLKPWLIGQYTLQIEARLEDPAGNNLNRLFDRDITNTKNTPSQQKVFELKWRVN
jgi:hypothetical protein